MRNEPRKIRLNKCDLNIHFNILRTGIVNVNESYLIPMSIDKFVELRKNPCFNCKLRSDCLIARGGNLNKEFVIVRLVCRKLEKFVERKFLWKVRDLEI